ncbi:MAG: endolytic transglycosylase MltG [Candidatus Pacebacteria bacterium]|nr:endolytic transglycosylase MltG [Candidatus Paceibacterota bacterium]
MKKIFFSLLLLILAGFFLHLLVQFLPPYSSRTAKESFILAKKTSDQALAVRLEEGGFVRSRTAFEQALKIKNLQGKIQPGGYYLSKNMSVFEIIEVLSSGPIQRWVTLPEGLRKEETADILGENLGWDSEQRQLFLDNSKEGYLFPETYLLDVDWSGGDIAKRLSGQFDKEFKVLSEGYDDGLSRDELVVLASLVQRESRGAEEMSMVSGIIFNRLNMGMKLDIDSTLQYQTGSPENWWPKVSAGVKSMESLYNTYLNKGLPPSPICSPGEEALVASMFPKKNSYLYYLHDAEGEAHYAETYEDHLRNIEKYLK